MRKTEISKRLILVIGTVLNRSEFTGEDKLNASLNDVIRLTMAANYEFNIVLSSFEGVQLFGSDKTINEMIDWIHKYLEPFDED